METMTKALNIPKTDSIDELAHFWQTHDLTDFEEELEEVHEPVFERQSPAKVTIRFQRQELEDIKGLAKAKGIDSSTLIREWVLEKLHPA